MSALRLLTCSRRTHHAVASAGTGFGTLQSQGTRFEVLRAVLIWHRVDWCIGFGGACRLHLQGSVPVCMASCFVTADVLLQNCMTVSGLVHWHTCIMLPTFSAFQFRKKRVGAWWRVVLGQVQLSLNVRAQCLQNGQTALRKSLTLSALFVVGHVATFGQCIDVSNLCWPKRMNPESRTITKDPKYIVGSKTMQGLYKDLAYCSVNFLLPCFEIGAGFHVERCQIPSVLISLQPSSHLSAVHFHDLYLVYD